MASGIAPQKGLEKKQLSNNLRIAHESALQQRRALAAIRLCSPFD
jgi:hypothetical protein